MSGDQQWNNILKLFSNSTHATASPILPDCSLFHSQRRRRTPRVAPYTSMNLGENEPGFYFDELSNHTSPNRG